MLFRAINFTNAPHRKSGGCRQFNCAKVYPEIHVAINSVKTKKASVQEAFFVILFLQILCNSFRHRSCLRAETVY